MARGRPINADVPAAEKQARAAESKPPAPPSSQTPKSRRRPIPGALKAIAGLVVLALVFILAAILGGRGGEEEAPSSPAPAVRSDGSSGEGAAAESAEQLGYPSFATNNTTRVGGGDPASNAAAVALAVYPSTDARQRPEAVALVDEGRWQDAVAAAVLMAAPVRAPLLVSSASGPPEATELALAALAPVGSRDADGAQAFAVGGVAPPGGLVTTPVGGRDPVQTAAEIAALRDRLAGKPPAHIVVAPLEAPDFAVPAAAWAARSGDPVLFAEADALPAATATALRRHPKVPVYVLGPSAAVSSQVVRAISKTGSQVRRVSGEDPVTNAIAMARYDGGGFGWNVNDPGHGFVVARAGSPLDAAVAAPLSASGTWGPLLLTDSAATLPPALRDYMLDVKPGYTTDPTRAFYNHVWVIGDEEAIDVNQQAEIDELAELVRAGEP
jgi:hypothetical protein